MAEVTKFVQTEGELTYFHEPQVFNYSILLLSEDDDILYVGAREVIFALNSLNIAEKQNEVYWMASEDQKDECAMKGKSIETECFNYIRVLQLLDENTLYVCGTNAFRPICDHLDLNIFQMEGRNEEGKGSSPFNPSESYTSVMVDGELYSGTSFNFLGSEHIIFRQSQQSKLKTDYHAHWLNAPRFVSADVIRESENDPNGDDDKIYFFFTENSVEFQFIDKMMIPRVARVCKGDQGGLRILQKKWTTFLKAALLCLTPKEIYVFNVVNDVFILKSPDLEEPLIYGVFTTQINNFEVSAVCTYSMSSVEKVFAEGQYMKQVSVENWETMWLQDTGEIPTPRPGACINNDDRAMNYTSSLDLPDRTLLFAKHHQLMLDSVSPLGKKPQLIMQDVNYQQIVVDMVKALDSNIYNIMFISTDKGTLHKVIISEHGTHIIEEIMLFQDSQPIQTLLLSSKNNQRYIYAGSNSMVAQTPVAFCEKYQTCIDCVLARDPYCAWNPHELTCVNILKEEHINGDLIQELNGDASPCIGHEKIKEEIFYHTFNPESTAELKCSPKSNLARLVWKFEDQILEINTSKYLFLKDALLIINFKPADTGVYHCISEEEGLNNTFSQYIVQHIVELCPERGKC
uniref:Semaphorin-4D-like n=1 Tax=Geotrypetes seraphini TaxID=260995 RepID=A0A6P8SK05_GEOSA|nr:semaphorin-4D-like [Geotrypetes seraphini]